MIALTVREEHPADLAAYATIPAAFDVSEVVDLTNFDAIVGGATVSSLPVTQPVRKDYDAIAGNEPDTWSRRFDDSGWVVLGAFAGDRRVGGAVVVRDGALTGLSDYTARDAVLWDIRVDPAVYGRGVGSALFAAAEGWARHRGCSRLLAETQDINVPACRFYASRGCKLERMVPGAYRDHPNEVQLIWSRWLDDDRETVK